MRVAVTGGSGKAGRAVVRELLAHDHRVLNVDLVPDPDPVCDFRRVDLQDLGQVFEVLHRAEAVVHLGAIPGPHLAADGETFHVNMTSSFNVFDAACKIGLTRVVWASSETAFGFPLAEGDLRYLPVDEEHPTNPKSTYALSKVLTEDMARYFHSRFRVPFVGLRFSNVWEDADYAQVESFQSNPRARSANAWGYVDARDVAQACRLGLEADTTGAEVYVVAAADTLMERSNEDLVAEVFPGVELRDHGRGHTTLQSIDKARAELGYSPSHSWRDH